MQKRFITCALILLVVGLLAGCGLEVVRDSITFEGKILPDSKLYVESYNGDVQVVSSTGDSIEIVYETWATGDTKQIVRDFLNSGEILVDGVHDNGVTRIVATREHLSQPNPDGIHDFGVNFTIKVPAEVVNDVEIQTSNGFVRVDGIAGTILAKSSNGDIQLFRAGGDLTAETSNGSVSGKDIGGNLDIQTSNGDVTISTTKVLKTVNIHTSGGNIDYKSLTSDTDGQYTLRTSNGSIDLDLPKTANLSFYAETSNGLISCDLPITDTNPENTVFEGNLNAGGVEVNAQTTNGNIHIYNDFR